MKLVQEHLLSVDDLPVSPAPKRRAPKRKTPAKRKQRRKRDYSSAEEEMDDEIDLELEEEGEDEEEDYIGPTSKKAKPAPQRRIFLYVLLILQPHLFLLKNTCFLKTRQDVQGQKGMSRYKPVRRRNMLSWESLLARPLCLICNLSLLYHLHGKSD